MNYDLSGFSNAMRPVSFTPPKELKPMFAFDRSALAVLLPLALLLAVVVLSNRSGESRNLRQAQSEQAQEDHTVAANLPSR
jgi:hypothetical protein